MVNIYSKTLLTLALSVSLNLCFSQETTLDSLQKELNKGENTDATLTEISKKAKEKGHLNKSFADLGLNFSIKNELKEWEVEFLLNQAKILLKKNKTTDAITLCLEAEQIINEWNDAAKHSWRVHLLLAEGLQKIGAYKEAIHHRKLQLQYNITRNQTNKTTYIQINNAIGSLYLKDEILDSAILYFKKSYYISIKHDSAEITNCLNNIGLGFQNKGDLDSALYYFTIAYDRMVSQNKTNTVKFGFISGNLSQCYPIEGNTKKIRQLLNDDIRLSKKFNLPYSLTNAYLGMANLNMFLKRYKIAINNIDSSMMIAKESNNKEAQLKILKKYITVFEKINDPKQVIKFSELYLALNDSLYGKKKTNKLIKSLTAYRISGIENELELKKIRLKESRQHIKELKKEEEYSQMKNTLTLSISLFLLIIGSLFIYKMKSDAKKRQEINKLNNQVYEASIENQTQRLTEATLSLTRKKEFSENVISKLSNIKGLIKTDLIPFKQFVINELQIDESILETEKYISKLSKDFFVKIKLQYPHLTENDIKMCGLIRLNLSIKQIAIIKYITPESVKISKNRLSKKMNLPPGTNLYKILKQY